MTDSPKLIGIYGASGFGKEVAPLLRTTTPQAELVFIDDNKSGGKIANYKIIKFEDFLAIDLPKAVVIAIADSKIRRTLSSKLEHYGINQLSVIASNSLTLDNVSMGSGSILCPFVTITSDVVIGKSFHANIYSYIAHDCRIGDFVTLAPAAKVNGNVIIEDDVYIGTGAIIKQGRPNKPLVIGAGAIIGMGAVVTKSVPAGKTMIGNPAKPLSKESLK